MKNKIIISFALICIFVLAFVGCTPTPEAVKLSAPSMLEITEKILTWKQVPNATGYVVLVAGNEYDVTEDQFELGFLTQAGDYEIKIKALGDGVNYTDSDWATKTYSVSEPPKSGTDSKGFKYTYLQEFDGYEVSRGTATLIGAVTIPDYYEGLPVVRIGDLSITYVEDQRNCFSEKYCNSATTSITLPKHLLSIASGALSYMVRVTEIVIPDTVVEIGDSAFCGNTHMTKVVLPKGLKKIPFACFKNTALAEINLPNSIEEIGNEAFFCETVTDQAVNHINSALSSVVIPKSVMKIGDMAFAGREKLKDVSILGDDMDWFGVNVLSDTQWYADQPDGLVYVGGKVLYCYKGEMPANFELNLPSTAIGVAGEALRNNPNLIKVTMPQGTKLLGERCFTYCINLVDIELPKDLKVIPTRSFAYNSASSIDLPSTLVEIGDYAFIGMDKIKKLTFPASLKKIGQYAFHTCYTLEEVEFANGLEVVGERAFAGCIALKNVVWPNGLKELGNKSFNGCDSLKSVFIPATLEILGETPFSSCEKLESIYFGGTAQQWEELVIQNNPSKIEQTFPFSSAVVYFFSQEQPTEQGNYWHYVDGQIELWFPSEEN